MRSRGVLLILTLLVSTLSALSQEATIEELRARAATLDRQADSVKRAWSIQWRRSDSLRIESMFVPMRSDSLRRAAQRALADAKRLEQDSLDRAPVDSTLVQLNDFDSAVVAALALRHRKGDIKLGQTLSDSATADVMRTDRDTGTASYYAEAFHGKATSSGEKYDMNDRTCAHRWLPYNTQVRVTNLANGRSVIVRVNDRGPWKHTRLIDLSKGAAKELDMIRSGTARVAIEVVDP